MSKIDSLEYVTDPKQISLYSDSEITPTADIAPAVGLYRRMSPYAGLPLPIKISQTVSRDGEDDDGNSTLASAVTSNYSDGISRRLQEQCASVPQYRDVFEEAATTRVTLDDLPNPNRIRKGKQGATPRKRKPESAVEEHRKMLKKKISDFGRFDEAIYRFNKCAISSKPTDSWKDTVTPSCPENSACSKLEPKEVCTADVSHMYPTVTSPAYHHRFPVTSEVKYEPIEADAAPPNTPHKPLSSADYLANQSLLWNTDDKQNSIISSFLSSQPSEKTDFQPFKYRPNIGGNHELSVNSGKFCLNRSMERLIPIEEDESQVWKNICTEFDGNPDFITKSQYDETGCLYPNRGKRRFSFSESSQTKYPRILSGDEDDMNRYKGRAVDNPSLLQSTFAAYDGLHCDTGCNSQEFMNSITSCQPFRQHQSRFIRTRAVTSCGAAESCEFSSNTTSHSLFEPGLSPIMEHQSPVSTDRFSSQDGIFVNPSSQPLFEEE